MTRHRPVFWLGIAVVFLFFGAGGLCQERNVIKGTLRVHPDNPRYFTDDTGRAILLTGAHTWNNLQSNAVYPPVDYAEYLEFLRRHNHNFIRMWAWEQAGWDPWAAGHMVVEPVPFARTGPGKAMDGKPKFDVTKFNEEYFQRLRSHVAAAQERGIYVSVMLLQGWSVEKKGQVGNPWQGHPFNKANNINGIDGDLNDDGQGPEIHTLDAPANVLERQHAYVRQVVDTVNDLDNVLYEIGNEMHVGSVRWQYRMIEFVRQYEKTRPKQHPIGMTGAPIANAALFDSPADWISPTSKDGYNSDPPPANGSKVIIADVDHVWPKQYRQWVWKSLTRGLNTAFMDLYGATKIGDKQIKDLRFVGDWVSQHETARKNMGYSRRCANWRRTRNQRKSTDDETSMGYECMFITHFHSGLMLAVIVPLLSVGAQPVPFAKWSKVELSFRGPASQGCGEPNPFAVKLDVEFRSPGGRHYRVPGFYDGDGRGGLDGDVWKVRFSADEGGSWTYTTISDNQELDGKTGGFVVTDVPTDAQGLWRWGRLEAVGTAENGIRYLKFRDGSFWLKAGCDDPENLLGGCKNYDTLDKRKAAVAYLAERGINSLYM